MFDSNRSYFLGKSHIRLAPLNLCSHTRLVNVVCNVSKSKLIRSGSETI